MDHLKSQEKDRQQIDLFHLIDYNRNNFIDMTELQTYLNCFSQKQIPDFALDEVLQKFDIKLEHGEDLKLDEFNKMMLQPMKLPNSKQEAREFFEIFDDEKTGKVIYLYLQSKGFLASF